MGALQSVVNRFKFLMAIIDVISFKNLYFSNYYIYTYFSIQGNPAAYLQLII